MILASFMLAATVAATPAQPPGLNVEERLQALTKALDLSPDQQVKIKPMLEITAGRIRDVLASGGAPGSHMDEIATILQDSQGRIMPILTDAQKRRWIELRQQRLERAKAKAPPPTPPGP